jgi:hypothetical protein
MQQPELFPALVDLYPARLDERALIARRIASHARWQRRARWLRLRALAFGRAKPRQPSLAPVPHPA